MTALRRVPVRIAGDWQPVAYVGRVRWEGIATAEEPITALALGRDETSIRWARAGRSDTNTLAIVLAVFPNETSDSRFDVRMHLSIGGAGLDTTMRLSTTAPFAFSFDHHATAEPTWFACPWSADGRYDFGALFVATSDTRSARNHLWHLRQGIAAPDGFAEALGYGRTGYVPTAQ